MIKHSLCAAKETFIMALLAYRLVTHRAQWLFNNISGRLEQCQRSGVKQPAVLPTSHSAHSLSPLTVALNYTQMETA